jgi:hypothetical protein
MSHGDDHTKGEVKYVRGSGPPILDVEGNPVEINAAVYVLAGNSYRPALPLAARVIGIDLTRRTVRLQVVGGREILYTADGGARGEGAYWLFGTADLARHNAERVAQAGVKRAEEAADRAIAALEDAKVALRHAEQWVPRDGDDVSFDS